LARPKRVHSGDKKVLNLLCMLCFVPWSADDRNQNAKELADFEGVWQFDQVIVDGIKQPVPPFDTNKMIITKNGLYTIVQGSRITRGAIKIDPSKTPKYYDVILRAGSAKETTFSGIYELAGDELKVCLPLRDKNRPASFASNPGSGCIIHAFKRQGRDVDPALQAVGRKELEGTWQAVTYALDGKKATEDDLKKVQLLFDAEGKTQALNDGKVFISSQTKIDLAAAPMKIDITFTDGSDKGKTSLGIYKVEDGVLTICRAAPGQSRPARFSSEAGSGLTLMTYEKVTKQ
jgi:uncharacterized protein (TIGR03067 family)